MSHEAVTPKPGMTHDRGMTLVEFAQTQGFASGLVVGMMLGAVLGAFVGISCFEFLREYIIPHLPFHPPH